MTVFVDTSALFSFLDVADRHHESASEGWTALARGDQALVTSNYVLVEVAVLLTRRLGLQAVRRFQAELAPELLVHWVDEPLHGQAMSAFLLAGRRDVSLVDWVSFAVMRQLGLDTAFAFDQHFSQHGFRLFQ